MGGNHLSADLRQHRQLPLLELGPDHGKSEQCSIEQGDQQH
jgi:hypothetical protein